MESISVILKKLNTLILQIEDLMEGSRPTPFSSKVTVDKNRVYELIDEMKAHLEDISGDLPDEIVKARRVVADSEKILDDARGKANLILRSAEVEAEKLISEHGITKNANAHADAIVDEARRYAKELRVTATEYADEKLMKAEDTIREALSNFSKTQRMIESSFSNTIDVIFENRQELRGADPQK